MEIVNFAVNAATQGLGAHDLALLAGRSLIGSFFAISGYHKLFNAKRHAHLASTMVNDKVPFPHFMEWWVPGWEFTGGVMLILGLFAPFAAAVLAIVCIVACCCEAKERVNAYNPIDLADRFDDYLYLPEVLYIVSLVGFILMGPGAYRLDALLF
jgi:putative oxidoreductase